MTRSQAREQAFIMIFEKEFNGEYSVDEIAETAKDAELFEPDDFALSLAKKTEENTQTLDELITDNLKGWKIGRISKVALAILRLAVCEMKFFEDIPVGVSINEAVELAKKYASTEDASFINGLLSSVNKKLSSDE